MIFHIGVLTYFCTYQYNEIMLNNFTVKNYKNITLEEPLRLDALNIFIGPNGCGKSNLFEAIQFLQDSIEHGLQKTIRTYRKGLDSILNKNTIPPCEINFKWCFSLLQRTMYFGGGIKPIEYLLDLEVFDFNKYSVKHETLKDSDEPTVEYTWKYIDFSYSKGTVIEGNKNAGTWTNEHPTEEVSEGEIALQVLSSPKQYPAIDHVKRNVTLWRFYNANHISIKQIKNKPSEIDPSDTYLDETGENLAIVLYNLISNDDSGFKDALDRLLLALYEDFEDLKFPIIDSKHLEMRWKKRDIRKPLPLDGLSDGTIRMLCWVAVLSHPNPSPLICIDEPEIGLHPEWIIILADLIKEAAESGKTQVLIATHSPDLLDCFSDSAENIIVTETDEQKNAVFKRLDMDELKPWLERYRLGEMYRNGDSVVGGWSY
ncbi:AAA family ATPase [Candidatus Magnetomonas plexicatena]|uniref:AAA family ATPase n=1 Tax=Candidatus Magnetomonas plexicatena TaxID=2552947 RepID=UPI001105629F|nr:AAA family ATPase [Nitrospirales bacterium LBB_01]